MVAEIFYLLIVDINIIAHKDIMGVIFGMSMDASSLIKVVDIVRSDMKGLSEQDKKLYRLYLIINALDIEMMKESVKHFEK